MKTIQNSCRLCGNKNAKVVDIVNNSKTHKQVNKLLPIVVMEFDPFPHKICPDCISKLHLFDQFYNETLKVEKIFKMKLGLLEQYQTETLINLKLDPIVIVHGHRLKQVTNNKQLEQKQPQPDEEESQNDISTREIPKNFLVNKVSKNQQIFICQLCYVVYITRASVFTHNCPKQNGIKSNEPSTSPSTSKRTIHDINIERDCSETSPASSTKTIDSSYQNKIKSNELSSSCSKKTIHYDNIEIDSSETSPPSSTKPAHSSYHNGKKSSETSLSKRTIQDVNKNGMNSSETLSVCSKESKPTGDINQDNEVKKKKRKKKKRKEVQSAQIINEEPIIIDFMSDDDIMFDTTSDLTQTQNSTNMPTTTDDVDKNTRPTPHIVLENQSIINEGKIITKKNTQENNISSIDYETIEIDLTET